MEEMFLRLAAILFVLAELFLIEAMSSDTVEVDLVWSGSVLIGGGLFLFITRLVLA